MQLATGNGFVGACAAHFQRDDPIRFTMDHQSGKSAFSQVSAKISGGKRGNAVQRALWRGEGGHVAGIYPSRFAHHHLAACGKEVGGESVQEHHPVFFYTVLDELDGCIVQTSFGLLQDLMQMGWNGASENCLGYPLGPVGSNVACHLAAAHRKFYERSIFQI